MSFFEELFNDIGSIAGKVIEPIAGFFSGGGDSYLSEVDAINAALNKEVGMDGLFSSSPGFMPFLQNNADTLYSLGKAGLGSYLERDIAKDYMRSQQPLMSLSAEQQRKYQEMMDPQKRALAQARIRRNMMGDIQPMLDRISDRAFMSARRRGTPIGGSTVGDYQGGLLSDMISKSYGDVYNYAQALDAKNVRDQMNMLTGQYKALSGSPQFQPTYLSASLTNPMRGFLSDYFL